jgi:hypothetical protein
LSEPARNPERARGARWDPIGWACLLVVIPPLWLAAPLVLAFTVIRLVRTPEAGTPTALAAIISLIVTPFSVYYVVALLRGAHP